MNHILTSDKGENMARIRVFDDSSSSNFALYRRKYNSTVLWNRTDAYLSGRKYSVMEDVVTLNFKAKRAAGEVILSPKTHLSYYSEEEATLIHGHGTEPGKVWENDTYVLMTHNGWNYALPRTLDAAKLWLSENASPDVAVAKAFAKVDISEVQALASLGEMPETLRWLASVFERVLNLVRFFTRAKKRIRKLKPTEAADALANLWLEFRYALRPFIFEAHAVLAAMKALIEKGSRKTARGWDREYDASSGSMQGYKDTATNLQLSYMTSISTNYRGGVLFDIESDINGIMALWGLDQPLESAWELVPFSFILDWFFNIGDVIAGWSANPHLRVLGSWVTIETVLVRKAEVETVSLTGVFYNVDHQYTPGKIQETAVISQRIILPDRPLLPSIRLNLDWAKLLDLATIGRGLYQAFRVA